MSEPHYAVLIHWFGEDQAHLVTLPDWRERVLGPVTNGAAYEEAVRHGKDARIAAARKNGGALPPLRRTSGGA